jgi:hypothetical protein
MPNFASAKTKTPARRLVPAGVYLTGYMSNYGLQIVAKPIGKPSCYGYPCQGYNQHYHQ